MYYFRSFDKKSCIEFKNCYEFNNNEKDNEYCEECNYGYALSYDGSECKQFENCAKLAKGDSKCSECAYFFHLNKEGMCERILCKTYENNICTGCFEGYYLDGDKNCKKITIENCLESDSKGEKCTKCIYDILPDTNGKCNLPLIKGCVQYGSDGKCTQCERKYNAYELKDGTCQFKECKEGEQKIEYCDECKAGYFAPANLRSVKKENKKLNIVMNVKQGILKVRMLMIMIYALDMMEAWILLLLILLLLEIKLNMLC